MFKLQCTSFNYIQEEWVLTPWTLRGGCYKWLLSFLNLYICRHSCIHVKILESLFKCILKSSIPFYTHWSKSPLASSRLVGKFRNHVEYTDFSQHLLNFRNKLILYLLKRKILRLLINPEKNYEDFFYLFMSRFWTARNY